MKLLLLILMLIGMHGYCQDKNKTNLYLDANLNKISEQEFLEKKQSWVFYPKEVVLDDHVYQMLDYTFEMGRLDSINTNKLRQDFAEFYKIPNDKNETLFIHYRKNLLGYSKTRERFGPVKVVVPYSYDTIQYKMTKAHYLKRKTSYDESVKKCHKFNSKHKITHIHLYGKNHGYEFDNMNFSWHPIKRNFQNQFFQYDDWAFLIIKPNGEFAKFSEFPHSKVKQLLKKRNWSSIKKTYEKAIANLEEERKGFFFNKWFLKDQEKLKINKKVSKNEYRKLYEEYRINMTETDCFYLGF
jgi:hypothetical protein